MIPPRPPRRLSRAHRYTFFSTKREVVDWLPDLSWVTNEAVVLISCNGPKVSAKRGAPPGPHPCSSASTSAPAEDGSPSANAVGDDFAHAAPGSEGQEEQEEEVLALAALERIRESYRARRKGRESEARRRREGVPEEDAGKRMVERKRGMENTAPFRQARRCRALCSADVRRVFRGSRSGVLRSLQYSCRRRCEVVRARGAGGTLVELFCIGVSLLHTVLFPALFAS